MKTDNLVLILPCLIRPIAIRPPSYAEDIQVLDKSVFNDLSNAVGLETVF